MKTESIVLLAAAGGVIYFVTKALKGKDEFDDSLLGRANKALSGGGVTATIPDIYGFKVPTTGLLGGTAKIPGVTAKRKKTDDGIELKIDVLKTLRQGFKLSKEYFASRRDIGEPIKDPVLKSDYEQARASAQAAGIGSGESQFTRTDIDGHLQNRLFPADYNFDQNDFVRAPSGRDFSLGGFDTPAYETSTPEDFQSRFEHEFNRDPGPPILHEL